MTGNLVDDGGALRIGSNAKWGEYFNGAIDEVRVYNRAQTVAELQADMNAPITGATPSAVARSATSAVADSPASEVCTSKTTPVSFTTPGTPPANPVEDVRHLTLGKDSFVIKTAKTDPTACNGVPCTVQDSASMTIGGTGVDRTATVIGFKLNDLPDGAGVSEAILKLGTSSCSANACPPDAVLMGRRLRNAVTSETKGSELDKDAETESTPYSLPVTSPQADIAGSEYWWLLFTSNKDEVITFGDASSTEQPSLTLTYIPPGSPSKVLNLYF